MMSLKLGIELWTFRKVVQLAQVVSGVEHHEIQKLNLSVYCIESHAALVSVQIDECAPS